MTKRRASGSELSNGLTEQREAGGGSEWEGERDGVDEE
jgi:hypothetical protein